MRSGNRSIVGCSACGVGVACRVIVTIWIDSCTLWLGMIASVRIVRGYWCSGRRNRLWHLSTHLLQRRIVLFLVSSSGCRTYSSACRSKLSILGQMVVSATLPEATLAIT